jgi:hypothetical protein
MSVTKLFSEKSNEKPFDFIEQTIQVQLEPLPSEDSTYRMHVQVGTPGMKIGRDDKDPNAGTYMSRTVVITKDLARKISRKVVDHAVTMRGKSLSCYLVINNICLQYLMELDETDRYSFKKEHGMSFNEFVEETWKGEKDQPEASMNLLHSTMESITKLMSPTILTNYLSQLEIDEDTPKH